MTKTPPKKPDRFTWVAVAETLNMIEADMIVSLLQTAGIPTYVARRDGLPSTFFGQGSMGRVYVPEAFYEDALDLLDDDLPEIDEPPIKPPD